MPSLAMHVGLAVAISAIFIGVTVGMDLDHFTRCNAKALAVDAVNPEKGAEMLDKLGQTNCRGFMHHWRTGMVLFAIFLAWVIHMLLDYVIFPPNPGVSLPW